MNENKFFCVENNNDEEIHKNLPHCLHLCAEYLGGVWKDVDATNVTLSNLSEGFSNTTLVCSLNEQAKLKNQDKNIPSKVVYKKYGSKTVYKEIMRECNTETEEALISQMLGINGISPMLYATFEGGRLEEFIESNSLTTNDLKDKEIVKSVARQVARLNSLKMPMRKNSDSFTKVMMQTVNVVVTRDVRKYKCYYQPFIKKLLNFELNKEGLWLMKKIEQLKSSVIFTHSDLNLNNILKVTGREEKVLLVDFDTACYYYRGRELNYFLTFSKYDLKRENDLPIINAAIDYDEQAIRFSFLQEYIDELNRLKAMDPQLDVPENIEEMDFEITLFELLFYLEMIAFAFWSIEDDKENIFVGVESFCPFIDIYNKRKLQLIGKYPEFYL